MRKLACTFVALLAFVPLFAQVDSLAVAADSLALNADSLTMSADSSAVVADSSNVKGYHPYDLEQNQFVSRYKANWSIIPHVGFNVFDGDFNGEMAHPIGYPSAGIGFEYDFTPVFGFGIEYMYSRYGVTGKTPQHVATLLAGQSHRGTAYLSMDLVGLFYPHDKRKIVSLNAMLGGGYGFYKTSAMFHDDRNTNANPVKNPTHFKGNTLNYINADGEKGKPDYMTKYAGSPLFQFALNIEFNLNRTLALGIRGSYDYFLTDAIDGRGYSGDAGIASKRYDGLLDVTLNLRIKIAGKEHSHVRNMGGSDPSVAISKHLAELDDDENAHAHAHGGRDTLVISHRDTIVTVREVRQAGERVIIKQMAPSGTQAYYIYFPSGKASINDAGLATIQQVADRMRGNEALYAVVTGYCDNTGSDKVNYRLGDKRAENVMDELVEEYDIPADHVFAGGVGKVVGKRNKAAYSPNRRVVIQLVDEETFQVLSSELKDRRAKREAKELNLQVVHKEEVPQAETRPQKAEAPQAKKEVAQPKKEVAPAKKEVIPAKKSVTPKEPVQAKKVINEQSPYAVRDGEDIVLPKNVSLAQLARKYYDNTHCWVYIYLANDNIINPNRLVSGSNLHIPVLTDEEMAITKEACLQLYYSQKRQ